MLALYAAVHVSVFLLTSVVECNKFRFCLFSQVFTDILSNAEQSIFGYLYN